jgi:two-component system response regulator
MGHAPHLLVVEDNPADVRLLELAFEEAGIEACFSVVRDGAEALEWTADHSHRPDVVLLDLNMPGMDGRELLAALRAAARTADLEIIVLSSTDSNDDITMCRRHAVRTYVVKPVDFGEFVDAAHRIAVLCRECLDPSRRSMRHDEHASGSLVPGL